MISPIVGSLGDAALLLPASLFLFAYLLWLRQPRLGLAFALSLVLAGAATIAAKLAFHACGAAITDLDVTSPSGHASFTTIFYGALALLLAAGRPASVRWSCAAATALLILAVGISRVRTGAHTPAEVAIGIGIGIVSFAVLAGLHRWAGAPSVPWPPVAIGFAVAVVLLGGAHFSLEHRIGRLARTLSNAFDICLEPERTGSRGFLILTR